MNLEEVKAQAEKEFQEEIFRVEVEKYKEKLRHYKSFWDKVWPWKILIIRKGDLNVRHKKSARRG